MSKPPPLLNRSDFLYLFVVVVALGVLMVLCVRYPAFSRAIGALAPAMQMVPGLYLLY